MSCPPFDLREYFLEELPESSRREVEHHLRGCGACREELDRLRMTRTALLTLADEEPPRRIGFVSDQVFEPSRLRRWAAGFWNSGARLGFASAAMLSVALLVHGFTRPAPLPPPAQPAPQITQADVERHVQAAVRTALVESEARTRTLLAETEHRNELDRQTVMLAVQDNLDFMRKKMNRMILAQTDFGEPK